MSKVDIFDPSLEDDEFDLEEGHLSLTEEILDPEQNPSFKVEFITGIAGTGKTFLLKKRIEDGEPGILAATTGIAAVNLGTVTINSLLKYYNTQSLIDKYVQGWLNKELLKIAKHYRWIAIDEVSMMDGIQLDIIYKALLKVNQQLPKSRPLGLIISGDFLQLPPIKASWAFEAECWPVFARHTLRLEKVWRQNNPQFLEALNYLRAGDGRRGVRALLKAGVKFSPSLDPNFVGTTIMAKNSAVSNFNEARLLKLKAPVILVNSYRWGKRPGEWEKLIPTVLRLKTTALVMILANDSPDFTYANGDLGHIEKYDEERKEFHIKLLRNGEIVIIGLLKRNNHSFDPPEQGKTEEDYEEYSDWITVVNDDGEQIRVPNKVASPWNEPYYDPEENKFVIGACKFFPIRLAYATTTHKSQSLTLDRVQIDIRQKFFESPGMVYVAMSRARTPEGLRIVGTMETVANRTQAASEVVRWL